MSEVQYIDKGKNINNQIYISSFDKKNQNNYLLLGNIGRSNHMRLFKESDFKKELVPQNAKLQYLKINGESIVIMKY